MINTRMNRYLSGPIHLRIVDGMDTKQIGARLDQAMQEARIPSQSELARMSGVPQPTINRILKGMGKQGPETVTLKRLTDALQIELRWLQEGIEPMKAGVRSTESEQLDISKLVPGAMRVHAIEEDDPNVTQIKKVKLRVQAGITGFQVDPEYYEGETQGVPTQWMMRNNLYKDALIAIVVKGESMEPSLYEGDIIVVNTQDTRLVDGVVYVVNYEGEAVVKRLSRDAGQWWLTSDNADQRKYHRKLCKGGECIVIGRVVRKESTHI